MQYEKKQSIFIGILVLGVLILFVPLNASAQTVNIPDVNLRRAINEALGKGPNARITKDEMLTLEELHANGRDIEDLSGLEAAVNLIELHLNDNLIDDLLPLAELHNLRELVAVSNLISDLSPIAGLINLRNLNIRHNLVSDLSPTAGLINLHWIELEDNLFNDISPLAELPKLEWMDLTRNTSIDVSPLAGMSSLTGFRSWGTPILGFETFRKIPRLERLDICGGELSDISALEGMTNLKDLYLAGNQITDISVVSSLTGLTESSFAHNRITNVSPLAGLSNLRWINLRDNDISDVSSLTSLPNLKWVDLSGNEVLNPAPIDVLQTRAKVIYHNNPVFPAGGPKIEGPWLWVPVPGNHLENNIDFLAAASDGKITEIKIATVGAADGKPVGDDEWIADNIAPVGKNNIGDMLGDRSERNIVYGSATLESPTEQQTRLFVGHHFGAKIWLNGEHIYFQDHGYWQQDYHRFLPVTLKAGTNVLLVALDNHQDGEWNAFFGFDPDTKYTMNAPISRDPSEIPVYDVDRDGRITVLDIIRVGQSFGKVTADTRQMDINRDGTVNISDLVLVANRLGEITGIPDAAAPLLAMGQVDLDLTVLQSWIAQAHVESDGSLVFRQGIATLERLLATLMPKTTALFANYPNPFNPETWIPYQLADPAEVILRIYATNGALVRTLDFGHQLAGVYRAKNRAAYWDGKNEVGESVASGVYFYTLTAGDFTATRKMLIRK